MGADPWPPAYQHQPVFEREPHAIARVVYAGSVRGYLPCQFIAHMQPERRCVASMGWLHV